MNSFNKKQKIIAGLILSIIVCCAYYYLYVKDSDIEIIGEEENGIINEEISNKSTEKETMEESQEEKIYVHISGAVNKEGVIELNENSRICDAIDKAEGLKEDAYIKDINLAYKLEDGMKIYIPTNKEQKENEKNNTTNNIETQINNDNTSKYIIDSEQSKVSNNNSKNTKININTATQTELETLPGIGPSTALKIINYRKENGEFKAIDDIKEVSGIGEAKFNNIKDLIII